MPVSKNRWLIALAVLIAGAGLGWQARSPSKENQPVQATGGVPVTPLPSNEAQPPKPLPLGRAGTVEARLIDIYRLIAQNDTRTALAQAEKLVAEHPNFQLAQLVYGDLLSSQLAQVGMFGDAPAAMLKQAPGALDQLRAESLARIRALQTPPPPNSVPINFLGLGPENEHALAVDVSQSRMYLFHNDGQGYKLVADYYISVGKAGASKTAEGDLRTPLGAYFVSSKLDPANLKDLYGAGAFPINYPNPYDNRHGKTGSGIWLHGTPKAQYSRPPQASDGCVVVSNSDLLSLSKQIAIRTTPVVIAQNLRWTDRSTPAGEPWQSLRATWDDWRSKWTPNTIDAALTFYADDFDAQGIKLPQFVKQLRQDALKTNGTAPTLGTPSMLYWPDPKGEEVMVVTFDQSPSPKARPTVMRQYWLRPKPGAPWKIIFQGALWRR